jgi:CRP-like cAMP-binding protein
MRDVFINTYLFSKLNPEQLNRVISFSCEIKLNDDEPLFEAGDRAKQFFLVKFGRIKLTLLSLNGNEKVIELVSPGSTFAEALMFTEQRGYPVRATAIGKTVLIGVDSNKFIELLRGSVDTCIHLMADMSVRLRQMVKEIDDLTLQTATTRIAGYLYSKYVTESHHEFDFDAPKGVIASRMSVKAETFSRILHNLIKHKVIEVNGNHVDILDTEALRKLAQSS